MWYVDGYIISLNQIGGKIAILTNKFFTFKHTDEAFQAHLSLLSSHVYL